MGIVGAPPCGPSIRGRPSVRENLVFPEKAGIHGLANNPMISYNKFELFVRTTRQILPMQTSAHGAFGRERVES